LGFLDAGDIGILLSEPVEKTLAGGGTDAVGVEADDSHEMREWGVGSGEWGVGNRKKRNALRRKPVGAPSGASFPAMRSECSPLKGLLQDSGCGWRLAGKTWRLSECCHHYFRFSRRNRICLDCLSRQPLNA